MKVRTGFVSNSSSSSFCLIFETATIDDINNDNFAILSETWDGKICFKPNEEMKDYLKKNGIEEIESSYEFIKIIYEFKEGRTTIKKEDLINILSESSNEVEVIQTDGSINSPYDLKEFIDWYNGD